MERRTRRRLLWTLAAIVVVVAAGVGGYLWWLKSDSARPVTVDDALAEFRAATTVAASTTSTSTGPTTSTGGSSTDAPGSTAGSTTTAAPPPATGVYLYATTGSESVDALGGSSHDYPATTTITVTMTSGGCVDSRWDALAQRWDEAQYCPGADGWELTSETAFHSFYQQDDQREFDCSADLVHLPTNPQPGDTFQGSCQSPGTGASGASSQQISGTVVGLEELQVGDQSVQTVHLKFETTIGGDSTGTDTSDRWYAVDDPLLLVKEVRNDTTTSQTAIGSVNYKESYELNLQSLEPQT